MIKINLKNAWKHDDPRDIPAYTIGQVAHYLNIPQQTVRSWFVGTTYSQKGRQITFHPVLKLPEKDSLLLSFYNLAEVHVLRSLRTKHLITLQNVRRALTYVKRQFGWNRPLLHQQFKTDGARLFVEHLGIVVDASGAGQIMFQEMIDHLERIEWDKDIAARLYPFTRNDTRDAPKSVMIDPRHSFGRPILADSRVATAVIAQRYKAGESIEELAEDYGCSHLEIEEGIRCELRTSAAA